MKHYDLIVSFGYGCGGSQTIRGANLQHASFPFDWLFYSEDPKRAAHDMQRRADEVLRGFPNWFGDENMVLLQSRSSCDIYRDTFTGCEFHHDFKHDIPLVSMLPAVRTKYQRRIKRFYRCLKSSRNILIVRMDPHSYPVTTAPEDCIEAQAMLHKRYPRKNFDILLFSFVKGVPYEKRTEREIAPGITQLVFDYANYNPNSAPYNPDLVLTSRILRERYTVRDYRTFRERLAHRWRRRLHRIRTRHGANSELEYRLMQIKRLFRLLRR